MFNEFKIANKIIAAELLLNKVVASEIVQTIIRQMTPYIDKYSAFFQKETGRKWKLFKPFVRDGENTLIIKWVPARKSIGDDEMWGLYVTYMSGSDTYKVKAFHVAKEVTHETSHADAVKWGREMEDIYYDQLGDPDLMFHTLEK